MDIDEIRNWYDGYSFEEVPSVYSPKSVISCMRLGRLGNYWNQTETFEALQLYIDMNFEGPEGRYLKYARRRGSSSKYRKFYE